MKPLEGELASRHGWASACPVLSCMGLTLGEPRLCVKETVLLGCLAWKTPLFPPFS